MCRKRGAPYPLWRRTAEAPDCGGPYRRYEHVQCLAGTFTRTYPAFLEHERAKGELKSLVPEDAQQAIGHGVRAKRSKSGAITFELLNADDGHAAV